MKAGIAGLKARSTLTVPWTTAIPDRDGSNKRPSPISSLKLSKPEKTRDISGHHAMAEGIDGPKGELTSGAHRKGVLAR